MSRKTKTAAWSIVIVIVIALILAAHHFDFAGFLKHLHQQAFAQQ